MLAAALPSTPLLRVVAKRMGFAARSTHPPSFSELHALPNRFFARLRRRRFGGRHDRIALAVAAGRLAWGGSMSAGAV